MLRSKHNQILEDSVRDFLEEINEIADGGWVLHSYPFETDDDMFVYNLQVSKVEFPVWICMGGNKIPKDGCRTFHVQDKPFRCKNCDNSEFKKIESEEELKSWRDNYES